MIPFSILDLSPITEGGSAGRALANTLDLARHGERLGFNRFWVAEHHNMPGIASAATAVVLAHVGAGTSSIRIGAGGVMLPNHAPLVIAEQFGTLAALFPGRVDLGLGRAPGTDPVTARALRRTLSSPDEFPRDVVELMAYLGDPGPQQIVRAVPGAGSHVPIWILGSSLYGAQVAAALGLPFSFASHFAPTHLMEAIRIYRERFEASAQLAHPYVMLGVNVVAAPSDAEARFLASSQRQSFTSLRQGHPIQLPPPSEAWQKPVEPAEPTELDRVLNASVVGSPDTVLRLLDAFVERTGADELIIASQIYDHAARLDSYRLVAEVRMTLAARLGQQPKMG